MTPHDIIDFWFHELSPADWWKKDETLDQSIKERFLAVHQQAVKGELFSWRDSDHGRLAEIIVIDQFSRNMFRDSPLSFAYDAIALILAQEAVSLGVNERLDQRQRPFLLMPYMHSESACIHQQAMELFALSGLEQNLAFEKKHKAIIDRFGRYPHRNAILGRSSTPEEMAFLQEPGSSF